MRESSTYQAVLEEGRVEGRVEGRMEGRMEGARAEARKLLLRLGAEFLGKPAPGVKKTIQAITELEHLERLTSRVPKVTSWEKLFAEPPPVKNNHKKS